jgi:hypothetical protein
MHYESNLSKLLSRLTTFFAAVEGGFNTAEQYEALARKSNSELVAFGFSHEGNVLKDVPSTYCSARTAKANAVK